MVYRLVCSLVYGICIASSSYAAAQSSETVKEEPAVQTEEKTEAANPAPTKIASAEKEVKPAETVLEPRESEEQLLARQKKIKELIERTGKAFLLISPKPPFFMGRQLISEVRKP